MKTKPAVVVSGFQISADYFQIEISDAIQQANSQRVLAGCVVSGIQEFCDLVTTVVPGDYSNIDTIRALSFNGSGYEYRGIDFSGSYLWELAGAGSLNFRLLSTKMLEQNFQSVPGGPFVDDVGPVETLQVYGTVNNLFDKDPPLAVGGGGFGASNVNGGTNAIFFDTMGRTIKLGVRAKF